MFCFRCHNDIADCTCPDIEERLRRAAAHPNIALTFCKQCGKYFTRCICSPNASE